MDTRFYTKPIELFHGSLKSTSLTKIVGDSYKGSQNFLIFVERMKLKVRTTDNTYICRGGGYTKRSIYNVLTFVYV